MIPPLAKRYREEGRLDAPLQKFQLKPEKPSKSTADQLELTSAKTDQLIPSMEVEAIAESLKAGLLQNGRWSGGYCCLRTGESRKAHI